MPNDYEIKFHPDFFKDLDKLDKKDVKIVEKQIEKVKQNPRRFKSLHGITNCYRIRIGNLRIVYYVKNRVIWFLTVEKRDTVYGIYLKRLYFIKSKL
jgi:addiction module RelE/StbE family toxin